MADDHGVNGEGQPHEEGQLVETHSLSKDEMNGKKGYLTTWDEAKGRWGVELVGESKALAVRPANLRAAAPPSRAAMEEAEQIAYGAAQLLKQARATEARATEQASARATAAHLIKQAEEMLDTAEAQDPAGFVVLTVRGDLAHMRRQPRLHAAAVKRSLANGRGSREEQLVGRMGLANALGESGDIAGEEAQLRAVLKLAPGHVHARFALGNLLMQKQRHDDAIVELMMAMQLPNDDPPLPEPHVQQVRGAARGQLCNCLGSGSQRAIKAGDHEKAVEMLERLLAVPGIDANETAKAASNLAMAFMKLDRLADAEAAAARATAANAPVGLTRSLAFTTAAELKERRADTATDAADEKAALYAEAKALYKSAHAACADPSSSAGFRRVCAKEHPDVEWIPTPAGDVTVLPEKTDGEVIQGSFLGGSGGVARKLREGVVLESID